MSIGTEPPVLDPFAIPPMPVRRFTVEEYLRLVRDGYFDQDNRYELLEGWIVPKTTKNPPHSVANALANEALRPMLRGRGFHLRDQDSVTAIDSVPEPDLAIVRGEIRDYSGRHPRPGDTALAVEVADSSLADDRKLKGRIYARAGIPFYWIVNLVHRQVEVYTDPTGPVDEPSYRSRLDFRPGESVPLILDGEEVGRVSVDDLLP